MHQRVLICFRIISVFSKNFPQIIKFVSAWIKIKILFSPSWSPPESNSHICRRSGFSPQPDLAQQFKTTDDEVKFGCNSQFVSMILLVVAALFFAVLAIMYVIMRSSDSFSLEDKGEFSCSHVSELDCGTEDRIIILYSFFCSKYLPSLSTRGGLDQICYIWGEEN